MKLDGWCGSCGETFNLSQVVAEGEGGRCPRCGIAFNHDYNAVVTSSVTALLAAYADLHDAAQRIADTAPLLHVDRAGLYKSLDAHLDR